MNNLNAMAYSVLHLKKRYRQHHLSDTSVHMMQSSGTLQGGKVMLKQQSCHKTIRLHGIAAKMCLCRVVAKLRKRKGLTGKCTSQSPYLLGDQCMTTKVPKWLWSSASCQRSNPSSVTQTENRPVLGSLLDLR